MFVRKPWPHIPHRMVKTTGERGSPFPLLWRVWMCQERRLSKRMLHFTANELAWECREGTACECSPNLEHITPDHLIGNNEDSGPEKWHSTIPEYSSLDLTYEKDKFPAISGIAKPMQQTRPSDIYLAGLWKSSLLKDLLWHASADLLDRPMARAKLVLGIYKLTYKLRHGSSSDLDPGIGGELQLHRTRSIRRALCRLSEVKGSAISGTSAL